ncbi:MAG: DUF4258 domain-containing protein [Bdellovibrionales bacterium]
MTISELVAILVMMELVFSKHAVEQMLNRSIRPHEVELLIAKPDGKISQSRDKQVLFKRFSKRKDNLIATVVVLQKENVLEVITVMHNFEVRK